MSKPMRTSFNLSLLMAFILCMSNSSCSKDYPGSVRSADFNTRFEMGVDDSVALPKWGKELFIKLSRINDSRCPENVQCIQAGKAEAGFTLVAEDLTEYDISLCLGQCSGTDKTSDTAAVNLNDTGYTIILHEIKRNGVAKAVLEIKKE